MDQVCPDQPSPAHRVCEGGKDRAVARDTPHHVAASGNILQEFPSRGEVLPNSGAGAGARPAVMGVGGVFVQLSPGQSTVLLGGRPAWVASIVRLPWAVMQKFGDGTGAWESRSAICH